MKNTFFKKILAISLSVSMFLGVIPTTLLANEAKTDNNVIAAEYGGAQDDNFVINSVDMPMLVDLSLVDGSGKAIDLVPVGTTDDFATALAAGWKNYEATVNSEIHGVQFTYKKAHSSNEVTFTSNLVDAYQSLTAMPADGIATNKNTATVRIRPSSVLEEHFTTERTVVVTASVSDPVDGNLGDYTISITRQDLSDIFNKFTAEEYDDGRTNTTKYWKYVPSDILPGEKLPVVVAMHAGAGGNTANKTILLASQIATKWAKDSEDGIARAIVIAPQAITSTDNGNIWNSRNSSRWLLEGYETGSQTSYYRNPYIELYQNGHSIHGMIQSVLDEYADYVDVDRVYLTGYSMGTMDAFALLAEYPDTFGGALLFSGNASLSETQLKAMKNVNLSVFFDERDYPTSADSTHVPITIAALTAAGNTNAQYHKFTEAEKPFVFPSAHESTWQQGLHTVENREWLFEQTRKPMLIVSSNLYGSLYTTGKSTNKEAFGQVVEYDPNTKATLQLNIEGLDDALIDSSNAVVKMIDGDGYYASEYIFNATELTGDWKNGQIDFKLKTGDIEINTEDYVIKDTNSGREWSCLGGDGHGNYWFNLSVSGITYDGVPVAEQSFRVHIYVYGFNYSDDAVTLYGANGTPTITPVQKPMENAPIVTTTDPVWSWDGIGEKPILCDNRADNFYVTWAAASAPAASNLTASDISVILKSKQGDQKVLTQGMDYVLYYDSEKNTTQIALIYQNWPFIPVYNTMDIVINADGSKYMHTFDIASVYVYQAQQGGGGTTVDGTVTAYSFYGFKNLASVDQIISNAFYTLRTTVDGTQMYYTEVDGVASLTATAASAKAFDANGSTERNLRLIGNTGYVTTRQNQTEEKTVNGTEYTFTKIYSGGSLLNPTTSDQSLVADDGYVIARGENNWISANNWITNEKWAWQKGVELGYTGIEVQPHGARYGQSLAKGTQTQFTATIDGEDVDVTWAIVGLQPSHNTTLSSEGLLTISADEPTGTKFSVLAVSNENGTLKGAVEVTVTAAQVSTYTVTFDPNGGERSGGGELSQQVSAGGAALAPIVVRSGYTFHGWDKTFDNVTANITVTAQWIIIPSEITTYTVIVTSRIGGSASGGGTFDLGTVVKLTAASDSGYTFSGWYDGSGQFVSNSNPYTFTLTANVTLEARFTTVSSNPSSSSSGSSSTTSTNIYVKSSDIVIKDGQVEVNLKNGSTKLSKTQMDDLIKKNKTMSVVIKGKGYTIIFAEDTMKSVSGQSSFDFGIALNTGENLTQIKSLSSDRFVSMVHFNYSGVLPAEAKITINVGAGFAGQKVQYYYYDETTKKLELIQEATIDTSGNVTVTQTHCSDYVFLKPSVEIMPVEVTPDPPTSTAAFSDIANHWAKADIEFVTEKGLFSGTGNGMFSPDATMTRGMVVTVLAKFANADTSSFTSSRFSDVAADEWYAPYVEWAAEKGIVQGVGDGEFAPVQSVTREQMAVILMNFATETGIQFTEGSGDDSLFVDDAKISSWARDAVTGIKLLGAISGRPDGSFDPLGTATRAEVASILKRIILKIV